MSISRSPWAESNWELIGVSLLLPLVEAAHWSGQTFVLTWDSCSAEGPGRICLPCTFSLQYGQTTALPVLTQVVATIYPRQSCSTYTVQVRHSSCPSSFLNEPDVVYNEALGDIPAVGQHSPRPARRCVLVRVCVCVYETVPSFNLLSACAPGKVFPIFLIQMKPEGYFSYENSQKWNHEGFLNLAERRLW